jgi:hypothetical protein
VAAASLLFTAAFFFEYLPPSPRVHVPFDMQSFHYPLLEYVFQSLRQGRLPEWDPTIYCGLSFAGNTQAALFYPPNWVLFLANAGREHLSYKSVQVLAFAHTWLAFVLCWSWLRAKPLGGMASALGAGIFAYSGYMMSQYQHLGVVTGLTWAPLALWGIDGRDRLPWKTVAASALCFLAGYPPTWVVFGMCLVVYGAAAGRLRAALAALAASVGVVMVQLLPAWEAATQMTREPKYGEDQGLRFFEHFYLGAPALFGFAALAWRRFRGALPGLALLVVSLVLLLNPLDLPRRALSHVPAAVQVARSFNFLEGVLLAVALLAAQGIDGFLRANARPRGKWIAVVLLLAAAVDYKVRGTSQPFNAEPGDVDEWYPGGAMAGLDDAVYRRMREHPDYRVAVGDTGPGPIDLRHYGLTTPQGFDPLLPAAYRPFLESVGVRFAEDRVFFLDPANETALKLLGVRYFLVIPNSRIYAALAAHPGFRPLEPAESFFRAFEYVRAVPAYYWESGRGEAERRVWRPEERELAVRSQGGGRFVLAEQYFPGWRAWVDGGEVPIERWRATLQAVEVPAGEHVVRFRFRSIGLRAGAAVTFLTLLALAALARRRRSQSAGRLP